MPSTARVCVRASILHLCVGAVIGALLLINRWTPLGPVVTALRSSHVAILVVGWLTQLIFGVAWWLFPALPLGLHPDGSRWLRHGQTQRGSETLFWVTFACLNSGVLLLAALGPLHLWLKQGILDVLAQALLLAAAIIFVSNGLWLRVREMGRAR